MTKSIAAILASSGWLRGVHSRPQASLLPGGPSILLGQHPTPHGIPDYICAGVREAFAKQRHTKLRPAACVCTIQTTQPLGSKYRDKVAQLPPPAECFRTDRTLPVSQVQDNPICAGFIEEMDTALGTVLKRLDELGLTDNTVVGCHQRQRIGNRSHLVKESDNQGLN